MKSQYDLGIYDSGIGGLTIAYALLHKYSAIRVLYYADNAYLPLGNKPRETILNRTYKALDFFKEHDCKSALLACNTAATACMSDGNMRDKYRGMRLYNVVDTLMGSIADKVHNKVLLLSTEASKKTGVFELLLDENNISEFQVLDASHLVPLIEEKNTFKEDEIRHILNQLVNELSFEPKTILLGCTHFPLVRHLFREVYGRDVKLYDAIYPTIEILKNELPSNLENTSQMDIHCTKGEPESLIEHYVKIDAYESAFV